MNEFYKLTGIFQWVIAIVLFLVGLLPLLVVLEKGATQPLFYLLVIIYMPLAQFTCTPFNKLTGVFRYYSPMLFGYMANNKQIDLHSGTSFDYLFVMRKYKSGVEFRNRILSYHLEGLIYIVQLIENKRVPETVNIVGTSYFFNNRTLQKMGFETKNPSIFYRLNLLLNFVDLIWMYSLSQGKFAIPKINIVKKASITGKSLIENKNRIEILYDKIKTKTIV